MAWQNIPNNPYWQYQDSPPDPGAGSPLRPLWLKQTDGVRRKGTHEVYTQVRRIPQDASNDNANRGEISKTFWTKVVFSGGAGVSVSSLDIANQTSDFSNSPTADGDGFFTLTGLDTTFLNDTNYHGLSLVGKSVMTRAKYTAHPAVGDASLRWGVRGTSLLTLRRNFELYYNPPLYHYVEVQGGRQDISSGAPIPSVGQEFYYGLHFPDATTLQFSFNGTVVYTENFVSGTWLTDNGAVRPYFRGYGGSGEMKVKWCSTLDTSTVADAYTFAQTI